MMIVILNSLVTQLIQQFQDKLTFIEMRSLKLSRKNSIQIQVEPLNKKSRKNSGCGVGLVNQPTALSLKNILCSEVVFPTQQDQITHKACNFINPVLAQVENKQTIDNPFLMAKVKCLILKEQNLALKQQQRTGASSKKLSQKNTIQSEENDQGVFQMSGDRVTFKKISGSQREKESNIIRNLEKRFGNV